MAELNDWVGREVHVSIYDEPTITGTLVETNNRGIVVDLGEHHKPVLSGLEETNDVMVFVPWIRIKGMVTASFKGLR